MTASNPHRQHQSAPMSERAGRSGQGPHLLRAATRQIRNTPSASGRAALDPSYAETACGVLHRARMWTAALLALAVAVAPAAASAQQGAPPAGWQTGVQPRGAAPETTIQKSAPQLQQPAEAPPQLRLDTTTPGVTAPQGQTVLVALLTDEGPRIDQGVTWHVYQDAGEGKPPRTVQTSKDPSPTLRLAPGDYTVTATYGRAHVTKRIAIKAGAPQSENFVLNAGGLRLTATLANGGPAPANLVSYDVLSDERDQSGQRTAILTGAKPGTIVRLNSGIYHVVSTYGDANAQVRTDVTVETGKLTELAVTHAAARVTFKLVTRAGGEALAETHWSILTPRGAVIRESVGALPTHLLAPGTYTAVARSSGRVFRRQFSVQAGQTTQVEVVMQ